MTEEEKKEVIETFEDEKIIDTYGDDFDEGFNIGIDTCVGIIENAFVGEIKETNLEHYLDWLIKIFENGTRNYYTIKKLIEEKTGKKIDNSNLNYSTDVLKWMAQPYEKTKIKLTQFEYDLLDVQPSKGFSFFNVPELISLQRKGYFKEIPSNTKIEDVLNNCEVKDDE